MAITEGLDDSFARQFPFKKVASLTIFAAKMKMNCLPRKNVMVFTLRAVSVQKLCRISVGRIVGIVETRQKHSMSDETPLVNRQIGRAQLPQLPNPIIRDVDQSNDLVS
jgi:hypothetical protein